MNAKKPDPPSKTIPKDRLPLSQRKLKELKAPIWEIQPTETAAGYSKFRTYRDMAPSMRSVRRAAEDLGLSEQTLSDYSIRFRWVERSRAYDATLETMLLAAQERAVRAQASTWAARAEEIRQMEFELSMGLAAKVREMLSHPVTRITKRRESRNGKVIYFTIIEPARWDFKAAADILQRIGFQSRLAAEMITDGARAPQQDGTDRGTADIDAWLASIGVNNAGIEVKEEV